MPRGHERPRGEFQIPPEFKVPEIDVRRITACRELKGLSKLKLSRRLAIESGYDYALNTMQRLESGETRPNNLTLIGHIARSLGVSPVNFYDPDAFDRLAQGKRDDIEVAEQGPPAKVPDENAEELIEGYKLTPALYEGRTTTIMFENTPDWHRTDINVAKGLDMPAGATIFGRVRLIMREADFGRRLPVEDIPDMYNMYATGEEVEYFSRAAYAHVQAKVRMVYGCILDSWSGSDWKELTGFHVEKIERICTDVQAP